MDEILPKNIVLTGFRDVDKSAMVIVNKIVSDYVSKVSDKCRNFERLTLIMKHVHENEKSTKFEIHGKLLDNGALLVAENTDKNMLLAIEKVLSKIESEMKD